MPVITLSGLKTKRVKMMMKKGCVHEVADRLLAAIHGKKGRSLAETADIVERPATAICGWPVRMRRMGPNGSARDKQPGAACRLDSERLDAPKDATMRGPAACGFPSGAWTVGMVVVWVKKKFGAVYGIVGMNRLPHRLGFARRKPRPRRPKAASRSKIGAFKKESHETVPECAAKGCKIMAGDVRSRTMGLRVRYGRYPEGADARPTAPSSPSGERFNAFGALAKGDLFPDFCDAADGGGFPDFLSKLHKKYGKVPLFVDNAGCHKSKKVKNGMKEMFGDDIAPGFFPPYTPELNPVEIQWRENKRHTANRPYENAAEMKRATRDMQESGEIKIVDTFGWPNTAARRERPRGRTAPRRDCTVGAARGFCWNCRMRRGAAPRGGKRPTHSATAPAGEGRRPSPAARPGARMCGEMRPGAPARRQRTGGSAPWSVRFLRISNQVTTAAYGVARSLQRARIQTAQNAFRAP